LRPRRVLRPDQRRETERPSNGGENGTRHVRVLPVMTLRMQGHVPDPVAAPLNPRPRGCVIQDTFPLITDKSGLMLLSVTDRNAHYE
jgi:hypothetical protein